MPKTLLFLYLMLLSAISFSQKDTSILIVPISKDMIILDNYISRMLKYNKVSQDSEKTIIRNLSLTRLYAKFPQYSLVNLQNNKEYCYLIDSLDVLFQWNSFQIKKITDSKGIERILEVNDDDPMKKYYGRVKDEKVDSIFQSLIQKYGYKYIFFINKFESTTRKPFSNTAFLCIHFEIYDQNFSKIFGGSSYWPAPISRNSYVSVFTYSAQKAFDDYFEYVKKFLK